MRKNRLDTDSIFLVLQNYDEYAVLSSHALCGYVCRHGYRGPAPDYATADDRRTARTGGRGHSVGLGDSQFHAFTPPRETQARGPGEGTPRGDVPLVSREHRRTERSSWLFVRGVLHTEPRDLSQRHRFDFQVKGEFNELPEHQGSSARKIRGGGQAGCFG